MAYELIYTSVPQGLQMGSSGFCTAAMTNGMSPILVQKLESLSGYKPCFSHTDQNYAKNPVSYFHYILRISGENLSLLGRVCSAGLDYTKRSNKLAHFLVADEKEKVACPGGPASFASANGAFVQSWTGQPQLYQSERVIAGRPYQPRVATHWGAYSGDPGWAGWLAQSFLDDPKSIVFVIFDPLRHTNVLELADESLQLLPEEIRWKVTFNTYMSSLSADSICNWRFCTDNKETLRACGWTPQSVVLDLRGKLPLSNLGNLVEQARTGNIPQAKKPIQVTVSPTVRATVTANDGSSLSLNELRRKKAEEETAAAAEKQRQEGARNKTMRRKDDYSRRGSDDSGSLSDSELRAWNYRNVSTAQSLNRKLNITIVLIVCFVLLVFAYQGVFYFFDYLPIKNELQKLSNEQLPKTEEAIKKLKELRDSYDQVHDRLKKIESNKLSIEAPTQELKKLTDKYNSLASDVKGFKTELQTIKINFAQNHVPSFVPAGTQGNKSFLLEGNDQQKLKAEDPKQR